MEENKIYYFYEGSLYRDFKIVIKEEKDCYIWKISAIEFSNLESEINIDSGTKNTWYDSFTAAMNVIIKIKESKRFKKFD